jgi:hypothetical protein
MLANGFTTADVPQTLVISYGYELPFGKGKTFLNSPSGVTGKLVSGWSINGITTFQSGQPFTVGVANNQLNNNSGGNLANITCNSVSTPKSVQEWFNTGCYSAPAPYTFGDAVAGAGGLYGPGIDNWDFSIAKDTSFGNENHKLRFEADFFNLFNNPHFSNPNATFGNANFGTISSDRLPPRLIQLGAKFSF